MSNGLFNAKRLMGARERERRESGTRAEKGKREKERRRELFLRINVWQ